MRKKRAVELLEVAKNSIGLTEGLIMARQELMTLLNQYKMLKQEIEQLMEQIKNKNSILTGLQANTLRGLRSHNH